MKLITTAFMVIIVSANAAFADSFLRATANFRTEGYEASLPDSLKAQVDEQNQKAKNQALGEAIDKLNCSMGQIDIVSVEVKEPQKSNAITLPGFRSDGASAKEGYIVVTAVCLTNIRLSNY